MKLVISLILNLIFAIALIVSLFFLRESNLERKEVISFLDDMEAAQWGMEKSVEDLRKENDKLKAELEKTIAARSRLKVLLDEARRSAPKPTTLFSERTAKKPATKPNASQEQ